MIAKNDRLTRYEKMMQAVPYDQMISSGELIRLGYFTAPASTKYHGNYYGGLFDHSVAVTESLLELTEKLGLEWQRPASPYIVGMYHDLCKAGLYVRDHTTDGWMYTQDVWLCGHGDKSVIITSRYMPLTDEEIACIRWHMGAYEKDTEMWKYYGNAVEKFPNVLYTHTADMIAAKIRKV